MKVKRFNEAINEDVEHKGREEKVLNVLKDKVEHWKKYHVWKYRPGNM